LTIANVLNPLHPARLTIQFRILRPFCPYPNSLAGSYRGHAGHTGHARWKPARSDAHANDMYQYLSGDHARRKRRLSSSAGVAWGTRHHSLLKSRGRPNRRHASASDILSDPLACVRFAAGSGSWTSDVRVACSRSFDWTTVHLSATKSVADLPRHCDDSTRRWRAAILPEADAVSAAGVHDI
jgi:hypothetical protein